MTSESPAKKRSARRAEVLRTARLTPHMIRIVFGGDGLGDFSVGEFSDHYVKLLFPPEGAGYRDPFDVDEVQAQYPRAQWPVTRTYTVRAWDPQRRELTIDFVYHGDHGLAGPWAAAAKPGDAISFFGPGGAYAPAPEADWHLLVGDASALPAIAASAERVPAGKPVSVFVEVDSPTEQQELTSPGALDVHWVYGFSADRPGVELAEQVLAAPWRPGVVHAFVHGEAALVKEVRRALRFERHVPREYLSASGYWRCGLSDEDWRARKKEWNRDIEVEEQVHGSPA